MILISDGYQSKDFSCHLEVIDYFGEELFVAILSGQHSQYVLSYC
jgi:hypothetical protein